MRTAIVKSAAATAGAVAAFLPVGRCPACYAAATGLAGSIGIGWIATSPWLLIVLAALLGLGLWGLSLSARAHRRWSAVWLGGAGAMMLMAGRMLAEPVIPWIGGLLLSVAFLLDLYWKRKVKQQSFVRVEQISSAHSAASSSRAAPLRKVVK